MGYKAHNMAILCFGIPSPIRPLTVGSGITPDLLTLKIQALAGFTLSRITAGGEFHPAPKVIQ